MLQATPEPKLAKRFQQFWKLLVAPDLRQPPGSMSRPWLKAEGSRSDGSIGYQRHLAMGQKEYRFWSICPFIKRGVFAQSRCRSGPPVPVSGNPSSRAFSCMSDRQVNWRIVFYILIFTCISTNGCTFRAWVASKKEEDKGEDSQFLGISPFASGKETPQKSKVSHQDLTLAPRIYAQQTFEQNGHNTSVVLRNMSGMEWREGQLLCMVQTALAGNRMDRRTHTNLQHEEEKKVQIRDKKNSPVYTWRRAWEGSNETLWRRDQDYGSYSMAKLYTYEKDPEWHGRDNPSGYNYSTDSSSGEFQCRESGEEQDGRGSDRERNDSPLGGFEEFTGRVSTHRGHQDPRKGSPKETTECRHAGIGAQNHQCKAGSRQSQGQSDAVRCLMGQLQECDDRKNRRTEKAIHRGSAGGMQSPKGERAQVSGATDRATTTSSHNSRNGIRPLYRRQEPGDRTTRGTDAGYPRGGRDGNGHPCRRPTRSQGSEHEAICQSISKEERRRRWCKTKCQGAQEGKGGRADVNGSKDGRDYECDRRDSHSTTQYPSATDETQTSLPPTKKAKDHYANIRVMGQLECVMDDDTLLSPTEEEAHNFNADLWKEERRNTNQQQNDSAKNTAEKTHGEDIRVLQVKHYDSRFMEDLDKCETIFQWEHQTYNPNCSTTMDTANTSEHRDWGIRILRIWSIGIAVASILLYVLRTRNRLQTSSYKPVLTIERKRISRRAGAGPRTTRLQNVAILWMILFSHVEGHWRNIGTHGQTWQGNEILASATEEANQKPNEKFMQYELTTGTWTTMTTREKNEGEYSTLMQTSARRRIIKLWGMAWRDRYALHHHSWSHMEGTPLSTFHLPDSNTMEYNLVAIERSERDYIAFDSRIELPVYMAISCISTEHRGIISWTHQRASTPYSFVMSLCNNDDLYLDWTCWAEEPNTIPCGGEIAARPGLSVKIYQRQRAPVSDSESEDGTTPSGTAMEELEEVQEWPDSDIEECTLFQRMHVGSIHEGLDWTLRDQLPPEDDTIRDRNFAADLDYLRSTIAIHPGTKFLKIARAHINPVWTAMALAWEIGQISPMKVLQDIGENWPDASGNRKLHDIETTYSSAYAYEEMILLLDLTSHDWDADRRVIHLVERIAILSDKIKMNAVAKVIEAPTSRKEIITIAEIEGCNHHYVCEVWINGQRITHNNQLWITTPSLIQIVRTLGAETQPLLSTMPEVSIPVGSNRFTALNEYLLKRQFGHAWRTITFRDSSRAVPPDAELTMQIFQQYETWTSFCTLTWPTLRITDWKAITADNTAYTSNNLANFDAIYMIVEMYNEDRWRLLLLERVIVEASMESQVIAHRMFHKVTKNDIIYSLDMEHKCADQQYECHTECNGNTLSVTGEHIAMDGDFCRLQVKQKNTQSCRVTERPRSHSQRAPLKRRYYSHLQSMREMQTKEELPRRRQRNDETSLMQTDRQKRSPPNNPVSARMARPSEPYAWIYLYVVGWDEPIRIWRGAYNGQDLTGFLTRQITVYEYHTHPYDYIWSAQSIHNHRSCMNIRSMHLWQQNTPR